MGSTFDFSLLDGKKPCFPAQIGTNTCQVEASRRLKACGFERPKIFSMDISRCWSRSVGGWCDDSATDVSEYPEIYSTENQVLAA